MTRSSSSPFATAELGAGGVGSLYVLGLLSAAKGIALVILADALARGIVQLIAEDDGWRSAMVWGLAAAIVRALASWATRVYAARLAIDTKQRTRAALAESLVTTESGTVGSMTALATKGLDELDKYSTTVLPAVTNMAVIPLLLGARILFADWISAVVILVTVPIIPIFMILIGQHTRERTDAATGALDRLSDHLVELARGLPVLVGLGRVADQTVALRRVSDEYRVRTMLTLRTAFLSALALELLSTISVAIVAVAIGIRLVDGTMPLYVGLLVLILAPECFTPFREVGSAFHASQDGVAALARAKAVIADSRPRVTPAPGEQVGVTGLTVRYPGRSVDAVTAVSFTIAPSSVTAITGPSGSGKSTVLSALAGALPADTVTAGEVRGVDVSRLAWVPQHPHTVGDTVRGELALYGAPPKKVEKRLARLGLAWAADLDPALLSPGELRRLAVARAVARVDAGATLVLLDEPTAHLDAAHARVVEQVIVELSARATVIVASHESSVVALASRVVTLAGRDVVVDTDDVVALDSPAEHAEVVEEHVEPVALATLVRPLADVVRPVRSRLILSLALGTLAALFAVALTATSGWLIVRAAGQPQIAYLLVAIVGVRFFGIGRAVLRYAERLTTHDAIFRSVTALRMRLWGALAARGASSRALLRGGTALDLLVGTADEVRDLAPRVLMPPVIGVACGIASVIAVAFLHAPALPTLIALLLIALFVAPFLSLWADDRASRAQALVRSRATRRFAGMLASARELRVNGVAPAVLAELAELDAADAKHARGAAWALGLGSAITIGAACAASALMLAAAESATITGTLPPEVIAVLVLLPLALIDPLLAVVEAVQQWPTFVQALARVGAIAQPMPAVGGEAPVTGPIDSIELDGLAARWPGSELDAFSGVDGTASAGEWLIVSGESGSGKSTLLTVMLGYLAPSAGRYLADGTDTATIDPASLRSHIAWCPQEGHLFDSSIRANLLLARSRDDAPTDDELIEAIRLARLEDVIAALPDGLETRIGSEGAQLSGGQRQRLAVARTLLARSEVVLLDEPTAHLDDDTARILMADLRLALAEHVTVLVTHHARDARASDRVVRLQPARTRAVSTG